MDCIFCRIVARNIPAEIVYENDSVLAFKDLNPVAPVHFLVIPKKHIVCANDINSENKNLIAEVFEAISVICKKQNISEYRIVNNCGAGAGQTVSHLHFHVLGGRELKWPPG